MTATILKIKEGASNSTTSFQASIKNAKINIKTMVQQVKCIKNSIARKVLKQKFLKFLKHYYSFNYTKSNRKPRHSEYYNFEKFKQKLNLSQSTSKFNISGVKKKVLKLVDLDLDDCFEVEEEKYGFRSNVTLAQNSCCILGLTCRSEP